MSRIKIKHGLPSFNEDVHRKLLEDGWKQLKEPKNIISSFVLSIPFMIINLMLTFLIMGIMAPNKTGSFSIGSIQEFLVSIIGIFLIGVLLIVCHELIHLIFIPDFIKSEKTYIGFTSFGGYVYTEEKISKYRACILFLAPFVLISILFNVVVGLLGHYSIPISLFIIFNSFGSCVDILGLTLILFQVPKGSEVINNGIATYFK